MGDHEALKYLAAVVGVTVLTLAALAQFAPSDLSLEQFVGIVILVASLAQSLSGYGIYLRRLQFRGAVLGALVAVVGVLASGGAQVAFGEPMFLAVVGLFGAVVGAVAMVKLHKFFVMAEGFIVGYLGAVFALQEEVFRVQPVGVVVGAISAVLAFRFHVVFIITVTSLFGGFGAAFSIPFLFGRVTSLTGPAVFERMTGFPALVGAVFFVGGVAVQYRKYLAGDVEPESDESAQDGIEGSESDESAGFESPAPGTGDDEDDPWKYRGIQ